LIGKLSDNLPPPGASMGRGLLLKGEEMEITFDVVKRKFEACVNVLDETKTCFTCQFKNISPNTKPCKNCFCTVLGFPVNPTEYKPRRAE